MEVDAFLILVLSVARRPRLGAWVLPIGLARYAARRGPAGCCRGCGGPLPPRYWCKVVAAVQGVVLDRRGGRRAADRRRPRRCSVGARLLLAESFGREVWWLWRTTAAERRAVPARAGAA